MEIIRLDAETRRVFQEKQRQRGTGAFPKEEAAVAEILAAVRTEGDAALLRYTAQFDGATLKADALRVTREEINAAYRAVDASLVDVMNRSAANIRAFHEKQKRTSWFDTRADGTLLGQRVIPLEIAGVYVPGGKAAYPSSVLMNVIPAKVAGVKKIVMTTPASKDGTVTPGTLVAADIAGVDEIYRVGGAQAIAAMAYGTETIPKTDKITGPGNIYVALAKKACFGHVAIDSIAGPSEILVLADDTANARHVAADLLSQAEHDEKASAVLITTSASLAEAVLAEIKEMTKRLERREIIEASLADYGCIFVASSMEEALDAVNEIASEHLEIMTAQPYETMARVKHAGAIFLGPWSSEPVGDYYAGPNHILPTNGTARFFSPVTVDDFVKKSSVIAYSEEALRKAADDVIRFAEAEGLTAHANSIRVRMT